MNVAVMDGGTRGDRWTHWVCDDGGKANLYYQTVAYAIKGAIKIKGAIPQEKLFTAW